MSTMAITSSQKRFVNAFTERLTESDSDKMMRVLREAMDAEMVVRAPKDGVRAHDYQHIPDHQIRLAAVAMLSNLTQHKPAAKMEVENTRIVESSDDVKRRVLSDIGGFMSILDQMKKLDTEVKKQPIVVTPIEVQTRP